MDEAVDEALLAYMAKRREEIEREAEASQTATSLQSKAAPAINHTLEGLLPDTVHCEVRL